MAKRTLLRALRALPKTLDGVELSIGRTIRTPSGKTLNPGDAVPAELLEASSLRGLVRNGYVLTSKPVDHRFLDSAKPDPEEPKSAAEAAEVVGPKSSKSEIRAALETAGYEVPAGSTKAELVAMLEAAKE